MQKIKAKERDELGIIFTLYHYRRAKNFDFNYRFPSEGNYTLLMLAAKYNFTDLTDYFLNFGADVRASGDENFTALHCAALWGNALLVRKLLRAGAEVDAITAQQDTPLHFAASRNVDFMIRLLFIYKAKVNAKNSQDQTPLYVAIANDRELAVKCLLELKGVEISDWQPWLLRSFYYGYPNATAIERLFLNAEKNGWGFRLPIPVEKNNIIPPSSLPRQVNKPPLPRRKSFQKQILQSRITKFFVSKKDSIQHISEKRNKSIIRNVSRNQKSKP